MCSFNRVILKGLTLQKFVSDVCLCMFCSWSDCFCRLTWQRVDIYIYEKNLEMHVCLWPEFDCPEVTSCGWQDIKIQLLWCIQFYFFLWLLTYPPPPPPYDCMNSVYPDITLQLTGHWYLDCCIWIESQWRLHLVVEMACQSIQVTPKDHQINQVDFWSSQSWWPDHAHDSSLCWCCI